MSTLPLWDQEEHPADLPFLTPEELFGNEPPDDEASRPLAADLPAAPSFSADEGWSWHDAALIALEQVHEEEATTHYAIGAVDLCANVHTGDLGGSYLEIGSFDDLDQAAAFYRTLQAEIDEKRLLPFQLVDFAGEKAQQRAVEHGLPAPGWTPAGPSEFAAYEDARSLNTLAAPDLPPDEPRFDNAFRTERAQEEAPTFKALREIGIQADGFNPETDPPPFLDPETGTAYWIGVFQPDKRDPEHCVTSILSVGRDPNTGAVEAQLAPCVPGDWDKAYSAAEYLLDVVEKDGINRCLDTAEGMALASDQRELWDAEHGIPLESDAAQDLADYTRDQWDIEL